MNKKIWNISSGWPNQNTSYQTQPVLQVGSINDLRNTINNGYMSTFEVHPRKNILEMCKRRWGIFLGWFLELKFGSKNVIYVVNESLLGPYNTSVASTLLLLCPHRRPLFFLLCPIERPLFLLLIPYIIIIM